METGDHLIIKTKYPGIIHHGIYCGDRAVIHFDGHSKSICKASLDDFVKPFSINEIKVIQYDHCDAAQTVMLRAEALLGKAQYDLVNRNCEHFAFYCKIGEWESNQIASKLFAAEGIGHLFYRTLLDIPRAFRGNPSAVENLPDAVKAVALIGWIVTGAIGSVGKFAQSLQKKNLPEE